MNAKLQKIAQDCRFIALMNLVKRGHNAVFRRPSGRLTWLGTDGDKSEDDAPPEAAKDNIFAM